MLKMTAQNASAPSSPSTGSSKNGIASPGVLSAPTSATYRRWEPLPKIMYGFAVAPFAPEADSVSPPATSDDNSSTHKDGALAALQPHLIGLEVGDEVYVFEQLGHDDIEWNRGYVVSTSRAPTATASMSSLSDFPAVPGTSAAATTLVEEPQVYVGMFPRSHVHIREELDDAELRLSDVYSRAVEAGVVNALAPPPTKLALPTSPMETLPEEDENAISQPTSPLTADFMAGNAHSASSAGKNSRSSQIDGVKFSIDAQKQSLTLQDQRNNEQRPPPPLPSLKCGDETASGTEEPLVDEIACALREWSTLMYVYLSRREYVLFRSVRKLIERLHASRRQLLAQTLSHDESVKLRRESVLLLVKGNVLQGLDVIVRHPDRGGLVGVNYSGKDSSTASWISGIRLYALQSALAYIDVEASGDRINALSDDASLAGPTAFGNILQPSTTSSLPNTQLGTVVHRKAFARKNSLVGRWSERTSSNFVSSNKADATPGIKYFHVFVELRSLAAMPCPPGETAELYLSLYNRADARFLTEEFCVIVNHQGIPVHSKRGKLRVLFTDLSVNDMHDLNIICRIIRQGAMRLSSSTSGAKAGITDTDEVSNALQSSQGDLPGFRKLRMTSDRTFRRPFGCAVVELGQEHAIQVDTESSSALQDHTMPIFLPTNESAFSTLHQDIIASRVREFERSPRADAVKVSVKIFHGEKRHLIQQNPALLQDIVQAARLGFPDVVLPGDTRNEVYIKLWSGEFFPHAGKVPVGTPQKNVQVSVEVRSREGSVIERAISRGAGEDPVSQFDSMVFHHQNGPTWGELLKMQIPGKAMEDCHLFFTFRYRSTKEERAISTATGHVQSAGNAQAFAAVPFAYAYLPLFASNRAFIPDGSHTLLLWRTSRPAPSVRPELYFSLPALVPTDSNLVDVIPANLNTIFQPLRDTLTLRTFLVSARYTQNEVLLRLLNWEKVLAESVDDLKELLIKFSFVGEVETVKFLRDIFDALFAILVSPWNSGGELDDLVFSSLVTVLGIVQDRRFNNFSVTLDVYVEQHYHSQSAHSRMISSIAKLLADPTSPEMSKTLRASIKVWPYIFKFIIRSRENQRGNRDPMGALGGAVNDHMEGDFRRELDSLLRGINGLMSTAKPSSIIGTQTLALQNFAGILPELSKVFPADELVRIEVAFADSVFATNGRMKAWKLLHILYVARDALMDNHAARSSMLPSLIRWIRPHIGRYDDNANHSQHQSAQDADRIAWVESARLAVAVIAVVLDKLQTSIVNGQAGKLSQAELRQEQDNVDYLLSMMPKLLETYIELCSSSMTLAMERHRSPSTISSDVPVVFPTTYPFPLIAKKAKAQGETAVNSRLHRNAQTEGTYLNCGLGEIASVLGVLVLLSPKRHLSGFLTEQLDLDGREKQSMLLKNFFQVGISILRNEAFPSTWLNINILSHQMVLKMADPVATLLIRDYIPTPDNSDLFDSDLWQAGLTMLVTLLCSEQLVIERFKPQRRRAVWRLAGDIRGEGAQTFARLWNAIGWAEQQGDSQQADAFDSSRLNTGGFQVQFVPALVEPVLELCLSHHDELRTCAVRILATMITSEWHLNGNFAVIEAEIIDKLDVLFVAETHGDDISRAFFIGQLRSLFENPQVDTQLQQQVHACLVSVNRFLDLLLSVRSLPLEDGFEDDRIAGTLKLLGFLRQANRVTAFSTHVLRLVNLHLENHSFVEAALTLKLHADLHDWSMDTFVEPIADLDLPRQSHFARKETLYMLILDYLNKGQAWEISIDICRELAREYEYRAVDYSRLADVLVLQASLFQKIGTEERVFPSYYRVAYYGAQWPPSLQGKNFIYRGNRWEKFSSFCERQHQRHPRATLIKSAMEPNDEVRSSTMMYLHIMAVHPEPDRTKDIFVNSDTSPIIRAYYEHNATDLFSFTKPLVSDTLSSAKLSPEEQLAGLWVEKTYLRCEDSFPTVLRRSEIAGIEVVQVSPIENALVDVENKITELETLEVKFLSLSKLVAHDASLNTNRLSMALNGAVDAPINGGIPMYRRTFLSATYLAKHPGDETLLNKLRSAIDRQAAVIYRCIALHSRLCPPEMRPFHDSLENFFAQNFVDEIQRLQLDMHALSREQVGISDAEDSRTLHADTLYGNGSTAATEREHRHGNDVRRAPGPITPLQRHIAYLTAQSQPIKASPTTVDNIARQEKLIPGVSNGHASSTALARPTTASTRNTTFDTATSTTPSTPSGMHEGQMAKVRSSTKPNNGTSSSGSLRLATSGSQPNPLTTLYKQGEAGKTTGSLASDNKSISTKRQSSLFSRVSESRDRASRLFKSDRRRS